MAPLFINETNSSSSSGSLTLEQLEDFIGDPGVLHATALLLGIVAIVWGKKFPQLLAVVAATSLGLWVALMVQNRQHFDEPVFGVMKLPDGVWLPIIAGMLAAVAAAALTYFTWRAALILLTAGIIMLVAVALCRLFEVSPERMFKLGASFLSAYRIVGAVVLILAIFTSVLLVRRFNDQMVSFASANLGTLLLLSGLSYFAQLVGAEAPFSLLDDLARIMSEVRGGRCKLWESTDNSGLRGCDCQEQCRTEIVAWMASTLAVLIGRYVIYRYRSDKKPKDEEERASLAANPELPASETPDPALIGKKA
mmetsp:Transcript_68206/g.134744  ORF Transcript_68206/g.134744 Transcript_68206/m.134744 type:complete len:309 (+) Transcript_68206:79-1005(+)